MLLFTEKYLNEFVPYTRMEKNERISKLCRALENRGKELSNDSFVSKKECLM